MKLKVTDIIRTPEEARRSFKNTAKWRSVRAAVLADHLKPCHLCGQLIRFDLKAPHPLSPSVDHLPGFEVERMVGHPVWEARRVLCDIDGLKPAHFGCNSAAGNNHRLANGNRWAVRTTEPTPEPEPLTPKVFRNQRTGEQETFYVNEHSIISAEWHAA
jgi:hypothetical protein